MERDGASGLVDEIFTGNLVFKAVDFVKEHSVYFVVSSLAAGAGVYGVSEYVIKPIIDAVYSGGVN